MFARTRAGGCTITRHATCLLVAAGLAVSGTLHAEVIRTMTPEAIAEAIRLGEKKTVQAYAMKRVRTLGGEEKKLGGLLRVQFATPFMRVAISATIAKLRGGKFTSADATPDLIAEELQIFAGCDTLADDPHVYAVNPSALSVLRADGTQVPPLRTTRPQEVMIRQVWGRKLNAPLPCKHIGAYYSLDVLDEGTTVRLDAEPFTYRKAVAAVSSEFRFELADVR